VRGGDQFLDPAEAQSGMNDTALPSIPPFRFKVEPPAVACVAEVLCDPNPIHFDAAVVQAAGLGDRPINQGPANLAYAINMLAAAFPDHALRDVRSRYLANVFVGDEVEVQGEVETEQGDEIVCRFRVLNGAGRDAVAGTATLVRRQKAPA